MNNLKTTQAQTMRKHLERMKETAEFLSHLAAGEAQAGRLHLSHECARLCVGQLAIMEATTKAWETIKTPDPSEN